MDTRQACRWWAEHRAVHRGLGAGGAGSAAGGAPPACGQHDPPQVGRCALLERNKAAATRCCSVLATVSDAKGF